MEWLCYLFQLFQVFFLSGLVICFAVEVLQFVSVLPCLFDSLYLPRKIDADYLILQTEENVNWIIVVDFKF